MHWFSQRGQQDALALYNDGLKKLRGGNRTAAYQSFLAAHQSGGELDRHRTQQLQEFLLSLAPKVVQASATSQLLPVHLTSRA